MLLQRRCSVPVPYMNTLFSHCAVYKQNLWSVLYINTLSVTVLNKNTFFFGHCAVCKHSLVSSRHRHTSVTVLIQTQCSVTALNINTLYSHCALYRLNLSSVPDINTLFDHPARYKHIPIFCAGYFLTICSSF